MQTFFNPKTPFFDAEGKPMANARVSFVSVDSSAALLVVKDFYGNILDNPTKTQSDGTLKDVPNFADGVSYKVLVEKPTGVEPVEVLGEIVNASELYEDPVEFIVSSMTKEDAEIEIPTVVSGIAGVRTADKALGSVTCIGYGSRDDGAPSREFVWVNNSNPPEDNSVNILRRENDYSGYWKMVVNDDVVDVRIGGVFPGNNGSVTSERLANLLSKYPESTTSDRSFYFQGGSYYLSMDATIPSMIVGSGARFYGLGRAVKLTIGNLENRGGKFMSDSSYYPVRPFIGGGVFRTSCLDGSLPGFLYNGESYTGIFNNVHTVIFDGSIDYSTLAITVDLGKKALVNATANALPSYIKSDIMLVMKDGVLTLDEFVSGKLSIKNNNIKYDGSTRMSINDSTGTVNFPFDVRIGELSAEEMTAEKATIEKLNYPSGKSIVYAYSASAGLTGFGTKGDVIVAVNNAEVQIFLTIDHSSYGESWNVTMPVNAGTAVQLICTRSYYEGGPETMGHEIPAKWVPMSPATTTRKNEE